MPYGAVVIGAMIGGAVVGAIGARQKGKAERAAANYNAKMNKDKARQEDRAGAAEQEQLLDERRKTLSRNLALYGVSGVTMVGTPTDVMIDTAKVITFDAGMARYNRGVRAQAYRNQAKLDRYGGKVAYQAGKIAMWQSILGGASQAGQYGSDQGWFRPKGTTTPAVA
jgi:hypothetical protein